ncbi:MAG: hypothetical protein GY725_03285 [bacterium]|nr:hypothetical protein [bacterium]
MSELMILSLVILTSLALLTGMSARRRRTHTIHGMLSDEQDCAVRKR